MQSSLSIAIVHCPLCNVTRSFHLWNFWENRRKLHNTRRIAFFHCIVDDDNDEDDDDDDDTHDDDDDGQNNKDVKNLHNTPGTASHQWGMWSWGPKNVKIIEIT